jgi:hypothetical protein
MSHQHKLLVMGLFSAATFAAALPASADTLTIKRPGARTQYTFEAEPHLLLGFVDPPGRDVDSDFGFGPGFRGTVEIVRNGFVGKINNSIGIGFGLDWVLYAGARGCDEDRGGPLGPNCEDEDVSYFWIPVVLQWNFWLSRQWSVFGEPGFAYGVINPGDNRFQPFVFYAGGRWQFTERAALTMRAGYPAFSVGVSFLL